jgi:hypothetical protein
VIFQLSGVSSETGGKRRKFEEKRDLKNPDSPFRMQFYQFYFFEFYFSEILEI